MEVSQKVPKQEIATAVKLEDLGYEDYVSYVAVGGLITDDDGKISKMSLDEFAKQLKVDRRTLYRWKKRPGFWTKVDERRSELFSRNRITAVWNGLFLRAAKGDAEQAKIILSQFVNWQPPSQKHEVQIGGLIDLARQAEKDNVIEAEVVDDTQADQQTIQAPEQTTPNA